MKETVSVMEQWDGSELDGLWYDEKGREVVFSRTTFPNWGKTREGKTIRCCLCKREIQALSGVVEYVAVAHESSYSDPLCCSCPDLAHPACWSARKRTN